MEPIIGKHYAPPAKQLSKSYDTISVAVCLVIPKSTRKGWKLSPAKVRVIGECSDLARIDDLTVRVARLLDGGLYQGQKNLQLSSKHAQKIFLSKPYTLE